MDKQKAFPIPTGYFSIALGMGAMAMAWRNAEKLLSQWALEISMFFGIAATLMWILCIVAYVFKWRYFREQALSEWNSVIQFPFLGLIPISAIIVAEVWLPYVPTIAKSFIFAGIAGQLLFAFIKVAPLWSGGKYCDKAILPSFYLPTVAANLTSAGALGILGYVDWGYLFFGAGVLSWLSFEPIILQHIRLEPIDETLRPSMGIILAPAFVTSAAYLSLNGAQVDLVVKMLWGYGLLQMLFLIRIFPWIAKKGFSLGFWAFSFGFASAISSSVALIKHYQEHSLGILAQGMFWFSNIVIALLVLGTLLRIVQGKFFVK